MSLPKVFEESGSIPEQFEHFYGDNSLCLGVAYELREKLHNHQNSFRYFFDEFVVGYLYSVAYFRRYGCHPYGDRSHGVEGIIEFYYERLGVRTIPQVVSLLTAVCSSRYRGHLYCPCGSNKIWRHCHGEVVLQLLNSEFKGQMFHDLSEILLYENAKTGRANGERNERRHIDRI